MKFLIALTFVVASSLVGSSIPPPSEPAGSEPGQVFVLKDFRWWQVIVKRTPTVIQCSFEVMNGGPTVHVELLSQRDFGLFARHHDYDTLAITKTGHSGQFQYMADVSDDYRVLIVNDAGAPDAAVSLVVRTEVDPVPASVSVDVSPRRKFAVILASLTFFFGTVMWSGRRLLLAWRKR